MDDIEQLARWLHRTVCRKRGRYWMARGSGPPLAWSELSDWRRDNYRAVASELLERPPAALHVPGVVVGGRS